MAAPAARVLVIEPVAVVRRHLMELLRSGGHAVRGCCGLSEAASAMAEEPWSVIVTELILPEAQGAEVVTRLRDMAPGVPVVVCSALTRRQMVVEARKAGAADFLAKPVMAERLARSIQRVLRGSEGEG